MKLSDMGGFTLDQLSREMDLFSTGRAHLLFRDEDTRYNVFKQINENELIKKHFLCGDIIWGMEQISGGGCRVYIFNITQILNL